MASLLDRHLHVAREEEHASSDQGRCPQGCELKEAKHGVTATTATAGQLGGAGGALASFFLEKG